MTTLITGSILSILQLSKETEPVSFYAVYDGHSGKDAAAFASSQLHQKILQSPLYPKDPVAAFKEAFVKTDQAFVDKRAVEVSV